MKRRTVMPQWAKTLSARACKVLGIRVPTIEWYEVDYLYSSGYCRYGGHAIRVNAGTDRDDARLVLLHELAHCAHPDESHTHAFWVTAMRLYKRYGVDPAYALHREEKYRAGAVKAFRKVFRSQAHLAPDYKFVQGERRGAITIFTVTVDGDTIGRIYRTGYYGHYVWSEDPSNLYRWNTRREAVSALVE